MAHLFERTRPLCEYVGEARVWRAAAFRGENWKIVFTGRSCRLEASLASEGAAE